MRTLKLTLEYDGANFSGWQTQPGRRTVQETVEGILRRLTHESIHVEVASRTDAGVHALGQVAFFKTSSLLPCKKFLTALNGLLPEDVAVKEVKEYPGSRSARPVKDKTYRYLLWNSPIRSPLLKDRSWHCWSPLNLAAMRRAAKHLVGRHNFSAFRGAGSGTRTSARRIFKIMICRSQGSLLQIEITGNGFLKYMVRNIVGTMVEIGRGRLAPDDVARILRSKDRTQAGITAPACGLCLVRVGC